MKKIFNKIKAFFDKLFNNKLFNNKLFNKNKNVQPLVRYNPSYDTGLTTEQVKEHILCNATNKKKKKFGKSYTSIILSNFLTLFNIIYVIIFFLLRSAKLSDPLQKFPITNYSFAIIVTINLLIGTIQEIRSKATIDKLQLLTEPTVMVVRDGYSKEIVTDDIVLDDIIEINIGKEIVCDGEIIHGSIEVNESQITGESVPIKKNIGDMVFSGSFVTAGQAYVHATKVGDDSEINKLALQAKKHQKSKSQILSSLRKLIFGISIFLVLSGIIMLLESYDFRGFLESEDVWKNRFYEDFYLNFLHKIKLFSGANKSWYDSITSTCTALLGMIPSGLIMMTSAALVLGVIKLSKHHTLVQDIYCVEMLARVDCLCLDKTGTITDGTMRVHKVIDFQTKNNLNIDEIMASINYHLNETNATSQAFIKHFGSKNLINIIDKIPFSSDKKYSGIVTDDGTFLVGSPEFVLLKDYQNYQAEVEKYASLGYRVLSLAKYDINILQNKTNKAPTLLAMFIIEDQIREDAYDTIKYFKENGVEVKVISGDNPLTVSTICKKVGIVQADKYISLDGLTDEEIRKNATKYTVFGRVKPDQKELLVKVLKENGKTVAMTGDGVNDILALKEADCSIVMASGNDAVKSVAKIVLLDSKFSSMPVIVEEGRKAINNIQKVATLYLLKTIFVLALALLTICGFFKATSGDASFPFSNPTQLLMIELFVIGIPSVILTIQPNKDKVSGHFLKNIFQKSLPGSLAIVIAIIITYLLCKPCGFPMKTTKTIVVLCATFIGIMVLYQACLPFNKIKIALFAVMTIACAFISMVSMTKYPRIRIANINFSEKISDAFCLDNLFSNYIVKLDNDNNEMFSTLITDAKNIKSNFTDSTDYDELILAKNADYVITNLTDETMIDFNAVKVLFDDYEEYLENKQEEFFKENQLENPEYNEELTKAKNDLENIEKLKESSKVNLSGLLLFLSMLSISYILMTVISYLLNFINKLELARIIRLNRYNENKDIDDNDEFLKLN